jgi:hypothetical protein
MTPMFGVWFWRHGVTIRLFGWLFQFKRTRDEMFSQRHDSRRIRALGVSIKLFGE